MSGKRNVNLHSSSLKYSRTKKNFLPCYANQPLFKNDGFCMRFVVRRCGKLVGFLASLHISSIQSPFLFGLISYLSEAELGAACVTGGAM